ncbi:hypothetical protein CsatB_015912 [Cannabis sativa]
MEFKSCSLIVPSVLEMTKDPNMVTVPSRYIQLEQDQLDEANIDLNSSSDDFPVINFQNLSLPMSHHNSQLYESELTKLDLACKNWGFFQILTNGLYPSIEHRVNPKEERLSIATFLNPNLKYDIGPASSLITPQNPPKYKTVTNKEYVKGTFSSEPDGKAYLDIMKL